MSQGHSPATRLSSPVFLRLTIRLALTETRLYHTLTSRCHPLPVGADLRVRPINRCILVICQQRADTQVRPYIDHKSPRNTYRHPSIQTHSDPHGSFPIPTEQSTNSSRENENSPRRTEIKLRKNEMKLRKNEMKLRKNEMKLRKNEIELRKNFLMPPWRIKKSSQGNC